ncbi:MAG: nucleotidyltransferase [Bacilli bacterium]|nr:nucleotidyltransferase [Bacilli bacterium]
MRSVGIICEYNPFHNGHLYHLKKVKELYPDYTIVLVLSGNFTQRGEVSIIDKWDKTDIALNFGIDLVIELPFIFATQSADTFAQASIEILNHLKVDCLVFGSESGDISKLIEVAKAQLENKKYSKLVKEYLNEGINYPTALSKAIFEITGKRISKSNDILGISYIREILKLNSLIKPVCIKRDNDYNDVFLYEEITSASSIRYAIKNNQQITTQVPEYVLPYLKENNCFIDDYFNLLKYKIISDQNRLDIYKTVDEGIENRINKYILNSNSFEELMLKIKTKRYTYNKLNRMFTHILCSLTKEEAMKYDHIEYIRVLGFSNKGRIYLKNIKNDITIPIITNFSSIKSDMLDLEFRTTCIYASIFDEKRKQELIEKEYKSYPIMK